MHERFSTRCAPGPSAAGAGGVVAAAAGQIVGVHSGTRMNVQYAKTENGSLLGLNTCHGAGNQRWEKLPGGLLRNVHSGRCLDALGWRTADGSRLGIWDCTPHHTNQQWTGPGLGA
ncbi:MULTISPECIES: RICIN domain-containing protein [unclassified Streptomyces]|uniref:RICIN domain-containing protein n=1 Tax=unclassified Streptomyces TaxID=2593676 RepID=UPI00340771FD